MKKNIVYRELEKLGEFVYSVPFLNNRHNVFTDSRLDHIIDKIDETEGNIARLSKKIQEAQLNANIAYNNGDYDVWNELLEDIAYMNDQIGYEIDYIRNNLWADIYNKIYLPMRKAKKGGTAALALQWMIYCDQR